jgi:hypothetical protein
VNALEDRLRTELRAESQLIAPESIPALSLPGHDGRRAATLRHRGPRRWPAWVAPLAAAAAVIAVIAAAVTVSGAIHGRGPAGHRPAASASPQQALDWTKQHPVLSPPARGLASMAYDAATRTVVLFGGDKLIAPCGCTNFSDTWTWNGTTWTKQAPAVHPPARFWASMAYDAATGTVVLFGGSNGNRDFGDTWTWNGTTWTRQHPATSPPALCCGSMAYDAATRTVVLFGGQLGTGGLVADTWTWDGTTWTQQHPATSPPARLAASMAYDAATGTVVLWGGFNRADTHFFGNTWTWNGTTWTKQHPATSPEAGIEASMAYDAATGTVVVFGGEDRDGTFFGNTWTWNGTTWTRQAPAVHPPGRYETSMAYDAATGTVVLFSGYTATGYLADTWTWG